MIPNNFSYCELDPRAVDRYGIPVLRFHFRWSDYELKQAQHMGEVFTEMITLMGGNPQPPSIRDASGISIGGSIIHEVGTVRMGDDARTSALNGFCQAHDADNVFVCDRRQLRQRPRQEPDTNDQRARMARVGVFCGEDETGRHLAVRGESRALHRGGRGARLARRGWGNIGDI